MADSQFSAVNLNTFLKGADNQGNVTPGKVPPLLVQMSNGGEVVPGGVTGPYGLSANAPQFIPQTPQAPPGAQFDARTVPAPQDSDSPYPGVAGIGCTSSFLSAMANGTHEHGQAPHTVGS
jgi:hypothetical protein